MPMPRRRSSVRTTRQERKAREAYNNRFKRKEPVLGLIVAASTVVSLLAALGLMIAFSG